MSATLYTISSFNFKPILVIVVLVSVLPFATVLLALYLATGSVNFKIPAVIGVLTLPLTIFLLAQLIMVKIVTEETQLTVGGGLYKETIARSAIRGEAIVTLDSAELRKALGIRVNGVGLPGFLLGWFQPRGGRKVFVLQTAGRAVLVPTTGAYDVIVSPDDTQAFIADLQRR
ncbi:MAG: hypothetical protein KF903_13530 [Dokdonella sp.]|uniref:PH domain-containing protein n=1 Tax=Dokdonella sp. TaxID=2291710 RepID=UPI0025BD00BC|nr:PH domain-containing protein [Dokdonella sp.]MBX3702007.1 hypothetical protein [Dokdonella sp.]MCW5577485.1 hypothetical protein [Dokdonella sp.]